MTAHSSLRLMPAMKHTLTVLILFFSNLLWATATPTQIKRAEAVIKNFIFPRQLIQMPAEKLKTYMEEITYANLRQGDILKISVDIKEMYRLTGKDYIDNEHEGFVYNSKKIELLKGDYVRVIRINKLNEIAFTNQKDFKGVEGSSIEVNEFILTKLDHNLEPIEDSFYLIARGGLDRKITDFERFKSGFFAQNPALSSSRAGVNDVIVSAQSVDTKYGKIPAYTPAIITKIVRTRIPWTISNYDYVFTLHLLNCPAQFQAQKCNVEIKGTKMYTDPTWAHYTMPENRREIKFLGTTLIY